MPSELVIPYADVQDMNVKYDPQKPIDDGLSYLLTVTINSHADSYRLIKHFFEYYYSITYRDIPPMTIKTFVMTVNMDKNGILKEVKISGIFEAVVMGITASGNYAFTETFRDIGKVKTITPLV